MKKIFTILLSVLITFILMPVNKISAEESELHISEEFAEKTIPENDRGSVWSNKRKLQIPTSLFPVFLIIFAF